jgi:hypothetical protein
MPPRTLEPSRAALALRQSPIPALRRLAGEETATPVVITGSVPTYYCKQMAQEAIRPLLAGRALVNAVKVVREES